MIHPLPSDIPAVLRRNPTAAPPTRSFLVRTRISQLVRIWSAAHLSYRGGQYSVERLLALHEYTRNASPCRVMCVITTLFLPVEVFFTCLEVIPLQDPALGWRANYGFWVRATVATVAALYTTLVQTKYFLKAYVISWRQQLLLIVCVTALQMVAVVIVAANVCFPIPFTVITMVPVFYVIGIVVNYIIVGVTVVRAVLADREPLMRFSSFIATQQMLSLIYPAYQVLFNAASNTDYELPIILLLPVIKLALKNLALRCVTHMEDMMPEAVIFTVDFFNALYMATSVQEMNSQPTITIIVLIDIAQSATVLFRLYQRTATILVRLGKASGTAGTLLDGIYWICNNEDSFKRQKRQQIQIRSCLAHNISVEACNLLSRLERSSCTKPENSHVGPITPIDANEANKSRYIGKGATRIHRQNRSILFPVQTYDSAKASDAQLFSELHSKNAASHSGILREALEVLFTTECLILSAIIDTFVPFLYGIYLLVTVHSQNAKYHSELASATVDTIGDVVRPIFVVSLVEFIALGLLVVLIHHNLGVNALYHLAFVLETQGELLRSKLLACLTLTMTFRVLHFGVDFTFKFAWLSDSK